ncbi:MAG TPA: L-seryl-tRNA(Sec) selenium transferase [Bryobacteraceae bacterium]|jgi:L-seryl-tRNA(Ser) seleniumtransferase|nr:L-seryl-tRNA(Sec) selenium transferase [Bryobacteraceae bacterium]
MPSARDLPSVDEVLRTIGIIDGVPRRLIANEIRRVLAERREVLQKGEEPDSLPIQEQVRLRIRALLEPSLRRVINATGVVLHTNLGRAPLPEFQPLTGYTNLEYDIESGKRGKRDSHIARLLEALLKRPGIVVNNNAAAVYLVLRELAKGGEVIVSRGELIEIGDGFRIPDIMLESGALLREVGTTNRTRIEDYEQAMSERTRLILRVHRSNFHLSGFTERPSLQQLAQLGRKSGIPVYEDLGSGCLTDPRRAGIEEPVVGESLKAGVNLVSFSGDKLLGGPQAGIIAGDGALVARIRRNPMYRAFRVDKLILQSLETTLHFALQEDWGRIPALRMIMTPVSELRARAERLCAQLESSIYCVRETASLIGGGSTPEQTLPTCVIEAKVPNAAQFERHLRAASTPVIARVEQGAVRIDLRTVLEEEETELVAALKGAEACLER